MTLNLNTFDPIVDTGLQAPYTAAPGYGSDSSSSKSSSSKKESLPKTGFEDVIKNIMEVMSKGKALPSDVWTYMTQMKDVITHAYDPSTGLADLTMFKYLLTDMAKMSTGYEEWTKIKDKMESSGTDLEAAITTHGQVYVMDPLAGLITKNIADLTEDDRTLTNGELLLARKDDPTLAYNSNVFTTIANAVNPEDITKHVMEIIGKVLSTGGKSEEFFGLNGLAVASILALGDMLTKGEGYVSKTTESSSNALQMASAFNYLTKMLPKNMISALLLRAKQYGTNVTNILSDLVNSEISSTNKVTYDVKAPTKQTELDALDGVKLSPAALLYVGRVPVMPNYQLSYGTANTYTGEALISNLVDASNNNLKAGALLTDFYPGDMKKLFDTSNIVMGNVKIDNPNMIRVKDSSMAVVELPIDLEAATHGVIRPDLQLLAKKDKADRRIRDEHASTPEEINNIYRECLLNPKYDANGNELTENYIRFVVVKGYIDKDTLDKQSMVDDDSWENYLSEIQNDATESWLKSLYKADKIDVGDLYEGNIYMPMITNNGMYRNAAMGAFDGLTVKLSTSVMRLDASRLASEVSNFKPAGGISSLLNQ